MARRQQPLEFAVLGLLHEGPMHGYELRKRLDLAIGLFRALSFGTLYPALRRLVAADYLTETTDATASAARPRITYRLTEAGRDRFAELASRLEADAYDDDGFELRLAFFARTESVVRLRVLDGRRARLEERLAALRAGARDPSAERDTWSLALRRHSEEQLERDIRRLTELAAAERSAPVARPGTLTDPGHPAFRSTTPPTQR